MTAVHGTFNRVTVAQVAGNGQYLTLDDLAAFLAECHLEDLPPGAPFALQHDQQGRWVIIQAVHETAWVGGVPPDGIDDTPDPPDDDTGWNEPGPAEHKPSEVDLQRIPMDEHPDDCHCTFHTGPRLADVMDGGPQ